MAAARAAQRVFTVVTTGGPCGGKTCALGHLKATLAAHGCDAYTIPEIPTIVQSGGFPYPGPEGGDLLKSFEHTLFSLQRTFEDRCRALALTRQLARHRPAVIIQDRALLDIKAYMPPDVWAWILSRESLTETQIFDRYDLVIHLVTAAEGAPAFYTTANNAARTECAELAIERDYAVRRVYAPLAERWHKVPNGPGGFEEKLRITTDLVVKALTSAFESRIKPAATSEPEHKRATVYRY